MNRPETALGLPEAPAFSDALTEELHRRVHSVTGSPDCKLVADIEWKDAAEAAESFSKLVTHGGDMAAFIFTNVRPPEFTTGAYETDPTHTIEQHIKAMWNVLERTSDDLPEPYIVPGERFTENFYWDNLEVMRGLAVQNRWDLIRGMVRNYSVMLERLGYIPNGNLREYFEGRSQITSFAEMVELLAEHDGDHIYEQYRPHLLLEHAFWMDGVERLGPDPDGEIRASGRVVMFPDGGVLNKYGSSVGGPRKEALCKDIETARQALEEHGMPPEEIDTLMIHLRAAAESGWDFSSRWLADKKNLATICTTDILPVDLNCNLVKLEQVLAHSYRLTGNYSEAESFTRRWEARAKLINEVFWDEEHGFYFDYNARSKRQTGVWSLAAAYPLDVGIAPKHRAKRALGHLRKFLQPGGFMTTLEETEQQWDGNNGWPPLQFRAVRAAWRNGDYSLALAGRRAFLASCEAIFTGIRKMKEKVNVQEVGLPGEQGEYTCQSGFGWTNGDYLALKYFMFAPADLRRVLGRTLMSLKQVVLPKTKEPGLR